MPRLELQSSLKQVSGVNVAPSSTSQVSPVATTLPPVTPAPSLQASVGIPNVSASPARTITRSRRYRRTVRQRFREWRTSPHFRRAVAAWIFLLIALTLRWDIATLDVLVHNGSTSPVAVLLAIFLRDMMALGVWAAFVSLPIWAVFGVLWAAFEAHFLRDTLARVARDPSALTDADALILRLPGSKTPPTTSTTNSVSLPSARAMCERRNGSRVAVLLHLLLWLLVGGLWVDSLLIRVAPPFRYTAPSHTEPWDNAPTAVPSTDNVQH